LITRPVSNDWDESFASVFTFKLPNELPFHYL
jgi:hypothetical protein